MKTLRCRDAGFDCDFEIRAQTVEEVIRLAAQHVSDVHQVEVMPEMAQQVSQMIHDEACREEIG
jgi:predicted small metal-binding protein